MGYLLVQSFSLKTIGYKRIKGHHCGEGGSATWNDGTNANWGVINGYHNCMKICNQHRDCVGFTHYPTDTSRTRNICILKSAISPVKDTQSDCYQKSKDSKFVHYCKNMFTFKI